MLETETTPRELFPISEASASRTLDAITQDSEYAYLSEVEFLSRKDPVLLELFGSIVSGEEVKVSDRNSFYEGAVWTWKVIRENAETVGTQMPTLSLEGALSFVHSLIEDEQDDSLQGQIVRIINEIKGDDSAMSNVITELSKYKTNKHSFNFGVVAVYTALKRMNESEQLTQSIQESPQA